MKRIKQKVGRPRKYPGSANTYYARLPDEKRKELLARSTTYRLANPIQSILYSAKHRAKKKGLEFNLTKEDIVIPATCPVLGIPLIFHTKGYRDNSPSLDRIDNSKGYTKENVIIVSMKANQIKTSANPDEILAVGNFYKKLIDKL